MNTTAETWTFYGHWQDSRIVITDVEPGDHDDDRVDAGEHEQGLWAAAGTGATRDEARAAALADYVCSRCGYALSGAVDICRDCHNKERYTMRTVADLRRHLVPGLTVSVVNHVYSELSGRRTVVQVQSNRVCLSLPVGHPKHATTEGSWLDWPKAAMCVFRDNAVVISRTPEWNDPGPFMTLTIN